MWTAHRAAAITLLTTLLQALCGCDQGPTPADTGSTEFDSAPFVEKMQSLCPNTGDADDKLKVDGSYQLRELETSWFYLPRQENLIQQTYKWEKDSSPISGPLTLEAQKGVLKGSLKVAELSSAALTGSLYIDGRFCLYGPVELAIAEAKASAMLFVKGQVDLTNNQQTTQGIRRLSFTANLGITADLQGKKYNVTSVVQAVGERPDPVIWGMASAGDGSWWVNLRGNEYLCWLKTRQLVCDDGAAQGPTPLHKLTKQLSDSAAP